MGMPNVVPETQQPVEEAGQGRSTIKFPYLDQDDAVEVARAVHQNFGRRCSRDQLAGHFKVQANGGGFNLRMVTAKLFGFVNSDKGEISLTPLGIRVCNPDSEKAARKESFYLVPLYKRVYDDFKGEMLPGNAGLEQHMEKAGVAPKQKDKARQAFQRSATQAGFFAYGTNRLVEPHLKAGEVATAPIDEETDEKESGSLAGGGDGNGGDGGDGKKTPTHNNPFIQGLLAKLPPENAVWTTEGRKKWLQTAASIFDLVYRSSEGDTSELSIALTKTSAN